jgi:hypothetical protein
VYSNARASGSTTTSEFCDQPQRLTPPRSSDRFQYWYAFAPLLRKSRIRRHA